jgi:hypothetical protein
VTEAAAEAGRDPASLGMEGHLRWQQDRDKLATAMRQWQDADATHLSVNTMGAGLNTVDDHLAAPWPPQPRQHFPLSCLFRPPAIATSRRPSGVRADSPLRGSAVLGPV